jgi:hypothetical protein
MSARLNTKIKNNRFFYMYRFGLDEYAVTKFLKQSKNELTINGAQGAKSLPEEFTHRAVFLATLPPKCYPIIAKWFTKNPPEGELTDLEESIDVLSKAGDSFDHTKESSKKHWRTIFLNYINSETTSIVKSFLIGEKSPKDNPTSKVITKKTEVKVKLSVKKEVSDSSKTSGEYRVITQNERINHGFSYLETKKLDLTSKYDTDGKSILGNVRTILESGQFFIDIKGILVESDLIEITQSQSTYLYPEKGSAVGFPERFSNLSVSENLLAIWNVHDQKNSMKARFMIDSCVNIVLDIIEIPHRSSEPDLIRSWLKNSYVANQGIRPVFELTDGIIIKPPSLLSDFKTYDFSIPFLGYYSHEAFKWNGRKIVIKPFPAHSFKYECISTETAVKRLFKFKSDVSGLPLITNKQIQDLASLVSKESTEKVFSNSYQAVSERISEIFAINENIDGLIDEILKLPAIKTRIDNEIIVLKNQISQELIAENKEIEALKKEKKSLEDGIKKSSDLVCKEIKKAFDNAAKNGESTLSQIAVLKPFLQRNSSDSFGFSNLNPNVSIEFNKKNELTTFKNLSTVLELHSLRYGLNKNLLSTFIVLGITRGVIGVCGKFYKRLIEVVSKITSDGFYVSISLSVDKFSFNDVLNTPAQPNCSLGNGLLLGDLLEAWQEQEFPLIVVVNGFNRVPAESIINELLDCGNFMNEKRSYIWKKPNGEVKNLVLMAPIFFVLNFAYGNSTFPIPKAYASEIPLISDEFLGDAYQREDDEISVNKSYLGNNFFSERLSLLDDVTEVELLKLIGLSELEAASYINLFLGVGRINLNELKDSLGNEISLKLDSLSPEYLQYIFEKS